MNKQLVFGVIAVVFATALIASLVVDQASANRNRQYVHSHSGQSHSGQSISQSCNQDQSSSVLTAGAGSRVTGSGNNAALCANTNNGGNAAAF
jgi:hypothetical protein